MNDQLALSYYWKLEQLLSPLQDHIGIPGGLKVVAGDVEVLHAGDGLLDSHRNVQVHQDGLHFVCNTNASLSSQIILARKPRIVGSFNGLHILANF